MGLSLIIPVPEQGLPGFRSVLPVVLGNLREADLPDARITVVLQTAADADGAATDFLDTPGVRVVRTGRLSASHARNVGIDELDPGRDRYVCFLDADAVPSTGLLRSVRSHLRESGEILVGEVRWCDRWPPEALAAEGAVRRVPVQRVLFSTYLWAAFLPVSLVLRSGARFDESIGPGEDSELEAGEDVLVLHEVVARAGVRGALAVDGAYALHPRRPDDFSKHLLYAEGQGALFVRLLRSRMPFALKGAVWKSLGLFLGNALFRVLTRKPNAPAILSGRLRGLLRGFRYDPIR